MIEGKKGTAYQIYNMWYSPNQMVFNLQILTLEISWHGEKIYIKYGPTRFTARFLYIQHCCGVTQVRNTRLSLVSSTNAASTCMC